MEYIIHLTEKCNLNCTYCYENKNGTDISFENIKSLIDYEVKQKNKISIICFYGGEPLIQKEMIKNTINYINSKKCKTKFYYGITTNGTILDKEFIEYMKKNNFCNIAYSIDGIEKSHDLNRITNEGNGSFKIVENNAKILLEQFKDTVAMIVITKNNLKYLVENVKYLIDMGFRCLNLQFDYNCDWLDEDLEEIKKQYNSVAMLYEEKILQEYDLDIPLIDDKIRTYIDDKYNCNEMCKFGMKTINVGTDGNFYPCMQFVKNAEYVIGNCVFGIDEEARNKLVKKSNKENKSCINCAIRKRCKHTCPCKNYMLTGDMNELSPVVCETERIIIDISDRMAERLYESNSKMFIQKYYNKNYNILKKYLDKK